MNTNELIILGLVVFQVTQSQVLKLEIRDEGGQPAIFVQPKAPLTELWYRLKVEEIANA